MRSTLKRKIAAIMATVCCITTICGNTGTALMAKAEEVSSSITAEVSGTKYNVLLKNGQTQLNVNGEVLLLTRECTTKYAGIDANGTIYTISYSGRCCVYNYRLQKNEVNPRLVVYLVNGEKFLTDSQGFVTEIVTTSGNVKPLTIDKFKNLVGITDSDNSSSSNSDSSSSATDSSSSSSSSSTSNSDSSSSATDSSSSSSSSSTSNSDSSSTTSTSTKKPSTTSTSSKKTVDKSKVVKKGTTYYVYKKDGKRRAVFTLTKTGVLTFGKKKISSIKRAGYVKATGHVVALTKKGNILVINSQGWTKYLFKKSKSAYVCKICYDKKGFMTKYVVKKTVTTKKLINKSVVKA